jgi:hypothetical protein
MNWRPDLSENRLTTRIVPNRQPSLSPPCPPCPPCESFLRPYCHFQLTPLGNEHIGGKCHRPIAVIHAISHLISSVKPRARSEINAPALNRRPVAVGVSEADLVHLHWTSPNHHRSVCRTFKDRDGWVSAKRAIAIPFSMAYDIKLGASFGPGVSWSSGSRGWGRR